MAVISFGMIRIICELIIDLVTPMTLKWWLYSHFAKGRFNTHAKRKGSRHIFKAPLSALTCLKWLSHVRFFGRLGCAFWGIYETLQMLRFITHENAWERTRTHENAAFAFTNILCKRTSWRRTWRSCETGFIDPGLIRYTQQAMAREKWHVHYDRCRKMNYRNFWNRSPGV